MQDPSEQIIAYVARKEDGASWTELQEEFEKGKGWSHGKFVNQLKKAKLDKRLNEAGRPRYFVKEDEETRKITLKQDIIKQSLTEASIPKQVIEQALLNHERALFRESVQEGGLLTKIKLRKKETQFFKRLEFKESVKCYSEAFRIHLLYPKGKMPPEIPEWGFQPLAQITFASQGFPKKLGNFKIILGYDSSREKPMCLFDKDAFAEWLKEFKGEKIEASLLEYLTQESALEDKEFATPLEEKEFQQTFLKYRKYQIEFMRKWRSFIGMQTELAHERLRKTSPNLYKKLMELERR